MESRTLVMVPTVVLGLALVCGTPRGGFAQTEAETAGREEPTEAGEAEPVEKLDEQLVTTTQRRTRSVSDAASSSSLLTSEEIQHLAGPDEVRTILRLSPNVQVENGSDRGPTFRGQDSTGVFFSLDAFASGARPRATTIVDGRPLSYKEYIFGLTSTWDVETVEIFQGPQTTTRGPNAIAGAVVVQTKDPTYEYEAALRGLGGNYETYQGSGMVSGPLIDEQLAFRAVVDYRDADSFMKLSHAPAIGVNPDEDGHLHARGKLLFEPKALPDFKAKLTYSYNNVLRPFIEVVDRPFVSRRRNLGADNNWLFSLRTKTRTTIADAEYARNGFTLSHRFAHTDLLFKHYAPRDSPSQVRFDADEFTNETLLRFDRADLPISGLGGVYTRVWDQDEVFREATIVSGVDPDYGPYSVTRKRSAIRDHKLALGVFGELTWSVTERLHLTAGLRYQRDNQQRSGGYTVCVHLDNIPAGSQCRTGKVGYDGTFSGMLPKAGLAYDVTANLRVGVQASRGFHPGGASLFSLQQEGYTDEEVWNYEMFLRSSWLDQRLFLDANVFVTDFDDAQRHIADHVVERGGDEDFFVLYDRVANIGDALSYGAEIQATYAPLDAVSLFVGLGLLETEIQDDTAYSTAQDGRLALTSLKGKEFSRAPSVSLSFGLTLEPLTGLVFSTQGRFTDEYYSDDGNLESNAIDSHFFTDAQLAYTFRNPYLPESEVRLFVFATNLFNNFYERQLWRSPPPVEGFASFDQSRYHAANVSDPREYGIGLEMRY